MRKALLAAVAVAALGTAGAIAQNTTTDNPSNGKAGMNTPATPGAMKAKPPAGTMGANPTAAAPVTAAQDAPKDGPSFIQVQSADMLSSNVVGLDVHNGQNDNIGKIEDIVFDPSRKPDGLHSVGRRLPRNGHAPCRGQSGLGDGVVRRTEQGLEGDHERHEGRAQVGSGIQVRRPVDGQQKLSGRRKYRNGRNRSVPPP